MKLALLEIRMLVFVLNKISTKELPIKTSFRLCRIMEKCQEENRRIEDMRAKLVKKYASSDKPNEKNEIEVGPENIDNFNVEFQTLLVEEIDLNIEDSLLSVNDLGDINISLQDASILQKIVKE